MTHKVAVVMFQLGGPDSPEAVEPFLYNLFKDPDIIDFPGAFLGRKALAKIISTLRTKKVIHHYEEIGGKSPIGELTHRQASALEARLKSEGVNATVLVAMRYWHPMTDAAIRAIKAGSFEKIILLPLYPQFSQATTYSSMNEWNREAHKQRLNGIQTQLICCYPNHPHMVDAFVENINASLARFGNTPREDIEILFSAHGVPVEFITNGDPYQLQVEETVRRIVERGKWASSHLVCYQSRVGLQQWLGPSLLKAIEERTLSGRKHLLVAPISFVTEHIETLHEIDMEARAYAMHHGAEQFEMMPALNDHPKFIACLADLVQARLHSRFDPVSKCERLSQEYPEKPVPTLCPWYGKPMR